MRPVLGALIGLIAQAIAEPWQRHTIDASSNGADGVRLADVNGDSLPDIVTPWEQGGSIRIYIHPGTGRAKEHWQRIEVGKVKSPEDAVFADLDGDGAKDVVSSCEGDEKTVFFHWAPGPGEAYLDEDQWETVAVASTLKKQRWMFCLPMQVDGQYGIDLIVGSKQPNAGVGWLQSPEDPRDVGNWKYRRLDEAGWIMSLEAFDFDRDGDQDILLSDRYGDHAGVRILENPGPEAAGEGGIWQKHRVGATGKEVMFLTTADLDADGATDILVSTRNGHFEWLFGAKNHANDPSWTLVEVPLPFSMPHGKSIAAGDINGDGRLDIVSTNRGKKTDRSVAWMESVQPRSDRWTVHDIGGTAGSKFDLIELLDLDGDGDLDVLTCEEVADLGVIWYENPVKRP